jgi:hypothetical protein
MSVWHSRTLRGGRQHEGPLQLGKQQRYTPAQMAAKFDPNIELNPTPILWAVAILVAAGFLTVFVIIKTGDAKPGSAAATAAP